MKDLYQNILDAAGEGICVIDTSNYTIKYANAAMYQILDTEDLNPMTIIHYLGNNETNSEQPFLLSEKRKESYSYETSWLNSKNEVRYGKVSVSAYREKKTDGAILVVTDITDLKMMQKHLEWISLRDEMSGLYNRRFFWEEVKRMDAERLLPLSIIVADLNGLKIINDCLGHEKGDEMLKKAAATIKQQFRSHDIVTRTGGDEFMVILPFTDESTAQQICMRIEEACQQVSLIKEGIPLSVSVGSATRVSMQTDIREIIQSADDAMYRRKLKQREASRESLIAAFVRNLKQMDNMSDKKIRQMEELVDQVSGHFDLNEIQKGDLQMLSLIHDIGHIGVPDEILYKEGALSEQEWEIMKRHSEIGYRIVQESERLKALADYVLYHHEWWNGNGYPEGLEGDEIPYIVRVWSVMDAYDAMVTDRPYRKAFGRSQAIARLRAMSGVQFDPDIVDRFIDSITGNDGKKAK
ncbi:MAG: diguanylate cyclase [Bacillota bacterium]|nr:diguanylate cyclase [Bacillota bacterium]